MSLLLTTHAPALAWRSALEVPHAVHWLPEGEDSGVQVFRSSGVQDTQPTTSSDRAVNDPSGRRSANRPADGNALQDSPPSLVRNERQGKGTRGGLGEKVFQPEHPNTRTPEHLNTSPLLPALFASENFPLTASHEDIRLQRDPLGKPFLTWHGEVAEWAAQQGKSDQHLHISNSHDGETHLWFAAYGEYLAGIGIDLVHLPRLRTPGKDKAYLLRFARHFMAPEEWEACQEQTADETEEETRLRIAAHFSLMEAASKACGTGLKMGGGMGTAYSLPKRDLGVQSLGPPVTLLFGPEAQARLNLLQTTHTAGYWASDHEFLVSVVLLFRETR